MLAQVTPKALHHLIWAKPLPSLEGQVKVLTDTLALVGEKPVKRRQVNYVTIGALWGLPPASALKFNFALRILARLDNDQSLGAPDRRTARIAKEILCSLPKYTDTSERIKTKPPGLRPGLPYAEVHEVAKAYRLTAMLITTNVVPLSIGPFPLARLHSQLGMILRRQRLPLEETILHATRTLHELSQSMAPINFSPEKVALIMAEAGKAIK